MNQYVFNPFTGKLDATGTGGGGAPTDATYLTGGDETATLTNSIQVGDIDGIMKCDGSSNFSAATEGVDYASVKSLNAGVVTLPTITDNGDGTVSISANGLFNFYVGNTTQAGIVQMTVTTPMLNQALTDGVVNYVYADYNGGTPIYGITLNPTDFSTNVDWSAIVRIIREGTDLHIISYDEYGTSLSNKLYYKNLFLNGFQRQSGLVLSTAATRISTITAGAAWFGVTLQALDENKAGTSGELYQYYLVSGVWNRSLVTAYDSSYYSDGTNRQTLSANQWVSKYFFRGVETDNHVYYIHGNTHPNVAQALAEEVPNAPTTISAHSLYVGKIVIQQGSTNGTAYPRAWDSTILSAGVTNHDDLANISLAANLVTYGHINDQAQTIVGVKTFGSTPLGLKYAVQATLNSSTALTTSEKAYIRIPSLLNGAILTSVGAMVKGASTSGDVTFTVKNGSTSMLSTAITVEAGEFDSTTATTQPVIDTAHDDVATADQIEVAVSGAGTGVTYAAVTLTFTK